LTNDYNKIMTISKYKKASVDKLKEKAIQLYKEGLSTREVGKIVKRSHEWVAKVVRGI